MPFTFSHPAAVLPFGRTASKRLSMTGLVIGSMTPDFEYFLRMREVSTYSHTWTGLLWFDLPLGIMLVIFYELWVKGPLIDSLTPGLYKRLFVFKGFRRDYTVAYFAAIFFSVAIGAASHILWDGFTHPTGYFVQHIPRLHRMILFHGRRYYVFSLLQHLSTIAGGVFILLVISSLPKKIDLSVSAREQRGAKGILAYWLQIILVTVVFVVIRLAMGLGLHQYADLIINVIDGGLIGVIVASLLAA